jgi:hypothetical protein
LLGLLGLLIVIATWLWGLGFGLAWASWASEEEEVGGGRPEVKSVAAEKRREVKQEELFAAKEQPVVKERSGARAVRRQEERDKAGDEDMDKAADDEEEGEEDVIDVKGLESRLKREKATGRVPSQNPKIGHLVKRDLGRELEDLKGEKLELKTQRFQKRRMSESQE